MFCITVWHLCAHSPFWSATCHAICITVSELLTIKNPSLTAEIITISVKTTISELYQFFLQTVVAKFAQDQDHSSDQKGQDPWFLNLCWSCGMVAKHLRVSKSCVWSLGLWAVGYGEAVAAKDKNGKWRRKRIETIMSRRSLKKMTNRVVFRINAINVRDRQLVKDILVNTRGPNMWIYRWYIWGFPLFPPRLYIPRAVLAPTRKCHPSQHHHVK